MRFIVAPHHLETIMVRNLLSYIVELPFKTNYVASPGMSSSVSSLTDTPENNLKIGSLNRKMDEVIKAFDAQQKENKELRDEINVLKDVIQEGVSRSRTSAKKKIPSQLSVELCSLETCLICTDTVACV